MLDGITPVSSYEEVLSICINKVIEILKETVVQATSIALVTYFSLEHSEAINSSIVIVGTATIEICSQFVKD